MVTDDAPNEDFRAPRLFLEADLSPGAAVALTREQTNYLVNVMRLGEGEQILVFNGRDGEWRARLVRTGRRDASLEIRSQSRPQVAGPDIVYLFAPLKRARLDYMVQKATELGVATLQPVLTARVNLDRMRANVIEAAEQCGVLRVPDVRPPMTLKAALGARDESRALIFCDEGAPIANPVAALSSLPPGPMAVLVGPEGGFDEAERHLLLACPGILRISLGPRIMRADTAAVAALALVNAVLGDWR
jgi:16S rRNA (uracil1498-N3)-methyltransferase